ncbi:response regulator containing CheY-like receiver, AAA-type ATPase, and DNA-binding domains [Longilinea arvoryzae]|uniref:Response regulator containing CheY-like receiver, AAA-type ATPase, and DNA-binding domains n=1 Tax=Longilinea arvoryzae TaxID=360412 RepID=A0A0S7BK82_9CHLR|nr:response regulator [Longilinea arvoryzae]GAP15572.1 response regulator containing CheY-like receiver, AAA-type ATPase, and DNA-binding domains [Longilinea arvoryzae]
MTLVLYVDDDAMSLKLLEKTSLLLGYEVLICPSPKRSIALACEKQPNVIVVDMNMHEMDGVTLIRALRNQADTRHIPVLVLSATETAVGQPSSMAAGANGYLSKPVDFDELSQAIDRVLAMQK